MHFDDDLDYYEYCDDMRQLQAMQQKVEMAASDPLLWDHFVPWEIYGEAYMRDQEVNPIQRRIQEYCFAYGARNMDMLQPGTSDLPEEWNGDARMRLGEAAEH